MLKPANKLTLSHMKIHYFIKSLLIIMLLAGATPSMASTSASAPVHESNEAYATSLKNRLEEIKAMDKTELSGAEKKALRKEVRAIKKELAAVSGGVYLSIGAIILIVLLIILLA
jgi:hypothetical protein